jgi:hypothetical protein
MLVWLTTPFEEEGMLVLVLVLGYWLELASTGKLKLEENSMTSGGARNF